MEILDVYDDLGTVHDFRMFKESPVGVLPENIIAMMDGGYRGVQAYLCNAVIPFKASWKHPLTDEQKQFNTELSRSRVSI